MARSRRSLGDWLADIVVWGERIETYLSTLEYQQFEDDEKTILAVVKCLEVIGEASFRIQRLDPDFERRHPEFALREAYAMRNRLAHGYFGIDVGIVWNTARLYVLQLVSAARKQIEDGNA